MGNAYSYLAPTTGFLGFGFGLALALRFGGARLLGRKEGGP
jgi:hypothetical protein